ncbi:MAG: CCA tRNA nucleotidyltransferase [Patescibacteria group bacterium]
MPSMKLHPDPAAASVCADLRAAGFDAYLVGGAVRDLLRGVTPGDWDAATSATPDEVMELFPKSLPTGLRYGTVTVRRDGREIQVTTFRGEGEYGDGRHPDTVAFGRSIEEDLARRDFTVNALAYDPATGRLIDPFGGRRDLRRGILRTVSDPALRFGEDALRMLRLYRFQATLGYRPDPAAEAAVDPALAAKLSRERIRDELAKLLPGTNAGPALRGLIISGLMDAIIPELSVFGKKESARSGSPSRSRKKENPADTKLWRHAILAVETIRPELRLRWAALLHDIGKPASRTEAGGEVHYYGHDELGAALARSVLESLRCPGGLVDDVAALVGLHMFQLPIQAGDAAVRRLLHRAGGPGRLLDLIELRRADIVATGSGYWRAAAYWRALKQRVEAVVAEGAAFSLKDLAVDGDDVMRTLGIGPGPEVGRILDRLLGMVLEQPELNERGRLEELMRRLY